MSPHALAELALAGAVVAWGVAFACAYARALLGHTPPGPSSPDGAPPDDERRSRALTTARLVAYLLGGATTVVFARAATTSTGVRAAAIVVAALAAALAEIAGREFGDRAIARGDRPPAGARRVADAVAVVLAPWVWAAGALDRALARVLPAPDVDPAAREEATEQFREIVAAEAEVGAGERALIAGVFTLTHTQVSEVMVPRVDVVGVEREAPWSEVVARVRSAQHSRVPVYDETIDDVIGVLSAKDLLPAVIADEPPAEGWATLIRPVAFIPTTKRVDDQLRDFRASRNHLAVVVDEYGGTAGIVTFEDLLEEIVGEIRDERDEEEPPVESEEGCRFWVSARLSLDELSEALGYDFRHDEVATVGGLIYELLGRVPRAGERLTIGPFRVVVERVFRRRIQRVYFERQEPVDESASAADAGAPAHASAEERT